MDALDDVKEIRFAPIEIDGRSYEMIALCEPTAEQMLKVSSIGGMNATIRLVADIAGVPVALVKRLPFTKLADADAYFEAFSAPVSDDDGDGGGLPESKEITFARPIEHDGKSYASITLCEPIVDQVLKVSETRGMLATIRLVADVAKVPEAVARKMPISRLSEADRYLQGFTGRSAKPLRA